MAGRARCWTVHMVIVVLATARCSVGQQSQHSGGAPKQLREIIRSAVVDAAGPIVAELRSQRTLLDGIVSRLEAQDARLNIIQAVINSQGASLDALKVRLDALNAGQDTIKAGQDTIKAGQDVLKAGQDALNAGQHALNATLNTLNTQVNISVADAQQALPPRDCSDLPTRDGTGIYTLRPGRDVGDLTDAAAFCDMDTAGGGWTVIQRRADILPRQDFYLDWASYREGFGNISGEFWWGLEKVWQLTSSQDRRYELRIELERNNGERAYALYQDFALSSEMDGYRLIGGKYSGDAEDGLIYAFGEQFSTKDRDQDGSDVHCAQHYKGPWWYSGACGVTNNLNGVHGGTSDTGVWWWRDAVPYHLKTAEMKVRPARRV